MTTGAASAVSGERLEFDSPAGRLSYYVAGSGAPLLLVHSVNAAASAAEVRPLHEHYRATRTVFSLDLPGYGFSDRSDRAYTPRLMTDALHADARADSRSAAAPVPVDALAVSLSCEFLARAAVEPPAALPQPGAGQSDRLQRQRRRRGAPGSTRGVPWLLPRAARSRLGRSALSRAHAAGRDPLFPGAHLGLARDRRRAGALRRADDAPARRRVRAAALPVGRTLQRGHQRRLRAAALARLDVATACAAISPTTAAVTVERRPNWRFTVFADRRVPFFEVAAEFVAAYDAFLAGQGLKESEGQAAAADRRKSTVPSTSVKP